MYNSILAISLNSYAFFGTSFTSAQSIETCVQQKSARFVCLDLGRLSGMDCTFADQIRLCLDRYAVKLMGSLWWLIVVYRCL